MNNNIIIDPEFSSLIPPLTDNEFSGLEKAIKEEGCRDALVVWNHDGKQILVDGHNRYKICQKHGIGFRTIQKEYESREEVKAWIASNQLGRRNVDDLTRIKLARIAKPIIAKEAFERMKSGKTNPVTKSSQGAEQSEGIKGEQAKPISDSPTVKSSEGLRRQNETRYKLAKAAGMAEQKFHQGETILDSGNEKLIAQVHSGKKTINQAYNEIVKKEEKKLPTASEYREQVQTRHEELKEQKIVSVDEIARDKRDVALLSNEIRADIAKAVKPIDKLYVMLTSKELDVSLLTDVDKRMSIASIKQATSLLNQIANMIEKG